MSSTLSNFRYLEAMAIYLDNNATTPLAPEVVSAIRQACEDAWANPSSGYKRGREAKAQYIYYDSTYVSFFTGLGQRLIACISAFKNFG